MKFKRAYLVEPRKFDIFEVDESPKGSEVLVKIASCGLCNWEINFWTGRLNFYGYPHPLGHEWSGVVSEAGPECKKLKVGDKVSGFVRGFGGFAEYKVINEQFCELLVDDIDPKYALGEPQKCILTVLRGARPEAGDNGVILGCGPMGLWCIQALKGNMLPNLIAVDIDDRKLELAKRYGVTHTINSKNKDAAERISEITNGHMADFIIEGTGIPSVLNEAQKYIKSTGRGRLVLMSSHEELCKEFDFRIAIDKCYELIIAHPYYSLDEREDFKRAVSLINHGTFEVKELISHEFKLEEIQKAFETLENKPSDYLKGIVVP